MPGARRRADRRSAARYGARAILSTLRSRHGVGGGMNIGDELVSLSEAAEIVGVTLAELRQLHSERLMRLMVTTDMPGAHFRRADIEALPADHEPYAEWTPGSDDPYGNSSELVEV